MVVPAQERPPRAPRPPVRVDRLHRRRLSRRTRAAVRHRDEGRHHQRGRLPAGGVRAGHHLPAALGGRCLGGGDRRRGRRRRGDGPSVRSAAPDDRRPPAPARPPPPASRRSPYRLPSPPADALPRGFLGLAQFPKLLAANQPDGRSLLFHLFRPQPEAERLFGLLSAVLEQKTELPDKPSRVQLLTAALAVVAHATAKAPIRSLLGVVLGLTLVVLGIVGLVRLPAGSGAVVVVTLALAIVVGVLATTVGLVIALLSGVLADLGRLPSVGFGMSSGRGADDSELALTPWLYRRLQDLAGRPYDQPLTFGHLQADELQLQMMTTNLSRSQPMAMPWNDDIYFFEPDEFEKLFGPVVVRAMVDHPPPLPSGPAGRRIREVLLVHAGAMRPFPRAADLPLIVATRMSLSFPLLISAVPLYAAGLHRRQPRVRQGGPRVAPAAPGREPGRARRGGHRAAGLRRQLVLRRRTDRQPAGAVLRLGAAVPADLRHRPGPLQRRPPAQRRRAGQQLPARWSTRAAGTGVRPGGRPSRCRPCSPSDCRWWRPRGPGWTRRR